MLCHCLSFVYYNFTVLHYQSIVNNAASDAKYHKK